MAKNNQNSHYRTKAEIEQSSPAPTLELVPCVKYVSDEWELWNNHWSSKMSDFEGYYDQWIGVPPTRDEQWQSQVHKMLTWQAEKSLVARFHSALFPISAPIDIDAEEIQDEFQAILAKSAVAHWFKIGKISEQFLDGMRSAGIYGTGPFEDDWYLKTKPVMNKEEIDEDDIRPMVDGEGQPMLDVDGNVRSFKVGTRKVKREIPRVRVVEDRYRVRAANIFAWRIHPDKLTDDDDKPVIKQEFVTYDDLMQRDIQAQKLGFPSFENMDKIKEDRTKIKEDDMRRLRKGGGYTDRKNPQIELLHYWGGYADPDKKETEEKKPMWITIANRKYRMRKIGNPRWDKKSPLLRIVWTKDAKPSWYGIGIAQIGKAAEERANNVVNTRTDIKKKNIKGTGRYNKNDKGLKKHIKINTPGYMRPCTDINNAYAFDLVPPLTPDDYKEEEVAVNDHKEITGNVPSLQPTANVKEQHKTLGGMQLLLGEAVSRLKPDLVMMELMGIRPIANRAFIMTTQFFDKPKFIKLLASDEQLDALKQRGIDKIYELKPGEITGQVNFHCTGLSESVETSQNIDKLLKFTEITGKIPGAMQIINYSEIIKRIALWLRFEDVEKFVLNIQQQLQQQAIREGAQGGAPGIVGAPQAGIPQGIPQGGPQGGLPPEILQQIAAGMGGGQPPVV